MIQSLVHARKISYSVQSRTQRTASSPAGAKEAFAIDLDKLFTPAERRTLANIKEHAKAQGKNDREIEMLEGDIIAAKHAEKSISHDIPIKEILGRQIRGIKDGYGDGSGPSLTFLQDIYNNFQKFQAVELVA